MMSDEEKKVLRDEMVEKGAEVSRRLKDGEISLEDAKKLAKQYGFVKFAYQFSNRKDVHESFTYKGKEYTLEPQDLWKDWETVKNERLEHTDVGNIVCKFQVVNSIYVDYLCRVWPCCYLPNAKHLIGDQNFYDDYYYDMSNNLIDKPLEEILNDNFYDILQSSWEKEETCLKPCSSICSFTDSVRTSNYRVNVW